MDYETGKQFEVIIANQAALEAQLAQIAAFLAEQFKKPKVAESAAQLDAEGKVVE